MKAAQRIWMVFSFLALSSSAFAQDVMDLPPLPEPVMQNAPVPDDMPSALPPLPEMPDASLGLRAPTPSLTEPLEVPDVASQPKAPTPSLAEPLQVLEGTLQPEAPTPSLAEPLQQPNAAASTASQPTSPSGPSVEGDIPDVGVPPLLDVAQRTADDDLPLPPADISEEDIVPPLADAPVPFSPPSVEETDVFDLFGQNEEVEEPRVRPAPKTQEQTTSVASIPVVIEKKPVSNVDLVPATGGDYRLPKSIYKKKYTRDNRHLPTARYEVEYDAQLFVAVANDNVDAVRGLLERGRNVNMQNATGESLVSYAVRHRSTNSLRLLLGRGADPDAGDIRGLTPLFYSMVADRPDYTQTMLSMGADPNQPNGEGLTPLMYAITKQNITYVNLLLAAGAEPNLTTFDGRSPLHVAAEYNNVPAAQALVQAGAFVNAQKLRGTTPLMSAAAAGSSQATTFLLAIGADTGFTDHLGRDASHLAKAFKQPVIANQIMTAATRRELAAASYQSAPREEVGITDVVPLAPQTQ